MPTEGSFFPSREKEKEKEKEREGSEGECESAALVAIVDRSIRIVT